MKLAFISDIHANIHALQAAWRVIQDSRVDQVIALGDLVGYGASPAECIEFVRNHNITCGLGSSDLRVSFEGVAKAERRKGISEEVLEWTRGVLSKEDKLYLQSFSPTGRLMTPYGRLRYCHGSPLSPEGRLDISQGTKTLEDMLTSLNCKILVCGGSHIPMVRELRNGGYVIDPGSVGLTLNREPGADVCIMDIGQQEVKIKMHKVVYDFHAAAFDILAWNLPPVLVQVIQTGKFS
ncbi:metallophosphoesterase family protein [Deinococcus roseus]|uniref:Metallophosphoesterase n=1 Tax=Deinococcus roseus TaxID=392414 RepID=A0ABQ2CX46_9DEIO|nr:metallophosphoesterase family protein [Deinococcus roseus]GGJ29530.1 metallophosphoesterase [Deinococcus roseus]